MTSHHDVAVVVAELRDPNAHYTSETGGDINLDRYIRWLLARCATAADLLESQAKALSEAEAERDATRSNAFKYLQECGAQAVRADAAEARLAEAMKHIDELTADLGEEIEGRYAGIKLYPSEARRYARDIATVVAARAFTNAAKEKT